MLRGREFTAGEEADATGVEPVIIDAPLAAQLFPDEDPIGRLLQFGAQSGGPDAQPMQIVGVAPAVRHDLMTRDPEGAHLPVVGPQPGQSHVCLCPRRRRRGCRRHPASGARPTAMRSMRPCRWCR